MVEDKPVVSICAYCKDIKDKNGKWHSLESVLPSIKRNSLFSHGICKPCSIKAMNTLKTG